MLEKVEQYPEKYNEFVLYMHRKGVCVGGLVLLYMHAGASMWGDWCYYTCMQGRLCGGIGVTIHACRGVYGISVIVHAHTKVDYIP